MDMIMTDDSLVHRKRKKRTTKKGSKRHWTIWLFFTLTTAIILCKAFDKIEGALNF